MWLYPALPHVVARSMAVEYARMAPSDLRVHLAGCEHPLAIYAATGGSRVPPQELEMLRSALQKCAEECGLEGNDVARRADLARFDAEATKVLSEQMKITPAGAADASIWAFMSCVVAPDLVRLRFPGDVEAGTALERFLGGARGLRNTFGRLWWRAYLLRDPNHENPYWLVEKLGEDELVQIVERPLVAGSTHLARSMACGLLKASQEHPTLKRSDLMRDAMKRIRRGLSVISFEGLDASQVVAMVDSVFEESVTAFSNHRDNGQPPPKAPRTRNSLMAMIGSFLGRTPTDS